MSSKNSFSARSTLKTGTEQVEIFRLDALERAGVGNVSRLPFSIKVLLENLLRHEDGRFVTPDDMRALAQWNPSAAARQRRSRSCRRACCCRILPAFRRSWIWRRCAKRSASWAATPKKINPLLPGELVIDHSVQVDKFGTADALCVQRRARISTQCRALRVSALGPKGLREFQSRAAGHRHLPSGESRISRASRFQREAGRQRGSRFPIRWSAPIRTPRWSTASAFSAGASAESKRKPPCSASRSRC